MAKEIPRSYMYFMAIVGTVFVASLAAPKKAMARARTKKKRY